MIFVTATSSGHLPRAMVMAKSVKEQMPGSKVIVGLMEEYIPAAAWRYPHFDEIMLFKDLNIYPNFNKFIFQYHVVEAGGAGKAQILKYAYEKFTDENVFVYLDTDMKVMSPLEELDDIFREHTIALTPHVSIAPEPFDPDYLRTVKYYGIYNAGFIALRRDPASQSFIDWWLRRVERAGYLNEDHFGDQTWIDLVPGYFDQVYTLRHPGYNVAFWNYHERRITQEGSQYLVNGQPIRCFHFSCYDSMFLSTLGHFPEDQRRLYMRLRDGYVSELEAADDGLSGQEWSYDRFYDGTVIDKKTRVAYRKHYYDDGGIENPFKLSNGYFRTSDAEDEEIRFEEPPAPVTALRQKRRAVRSGKRGPAKKRAAANRNGSRKTKKGTARRAKRGGVKTGRKAARKTAKTADSKRVLLKIPARIVRNKKRA